MKQLKGMTWNHPRGIQPLIEASERFKQAYDVEITWDARSLSDFELFPLEELASAYDFIMIDHPHIGIAHAKKLLLPLETLLSEGQLEKQKKGEVGQSYNSYTYEGHQYALPVDAATQVSAFRRDLIAGDIPTTWNDVFSLAKTFGDTKKIAIPFVPVHAYSSFFTLCSHFSTEAFWSEGSDLSIEAGVKALELLIELLSIAHPDSKDMDPIMMLDRMMSEDDIAYAPLVYGYSNYARDGFGTHLVEFKDMPKACDTPHGSMIGGVGLAISSGCQNIEEARLFLNVVSHPSYQKGAFFDGGGQPGHMKAWVDERVNTINHSFFKGTLDTIKLGSLRPRFEGYIDFQASAGNQIREFVLDGTGDKKAFIEHLNTLIRQCRENKGL